MRAAGNSAALLFLIFLKIKIMKTKWGAIVVEGSGKVGGHVGYKSKTTSCLRTKTTPTKSAVSSQLLIRSTFVQLSQAWRKLTETQRLAWNNVVSDYARSNVFGDKIKPSGFLLFCRLNNNRLNVGLFILEDAPEYFPTFSIALDLLDLNYSSAALFLHFSPLQKLGSSVKVFATRPLSPGISKVRAQYRQITVLPELNVSPINIAASYIAKFGNLGKVGLKIFVKIVPVNFVNGLEGLPSSNYHLATI